MTAGGFAVPAPRLPPVENWNPPFCGDSAMRIARDGRWFHDGAPIARPELVRLFAGLLRKDAEGFVLVTPAEKLSILVEDAPFIAVAMESEAGRLIFTTNVGDAIVLRPEHGLRVAGGIPYLHVRRGLEARLARSVWYQLADLAAPHDGQLGVWSEDCFFALEPRE